MGEVDPMLSRSTRVHEQSQDNKHLQVACWDFNFIISNLRCPCMYICKFLTTLTTIQYFILIFLSPLRLFVFFLDNFVEAIPS